MDLMHGCNELLVAYNFCPPLVLKREEIKEILSDILGREKSAQGSTNLLPNEMTPDRPHSVLQKAAEYV